MTALPDRATGAPVAIGIEIADAATRMTALLDPETTAARWHVRLTTPPPPDDAIQQINALVTRVLTERNLLAGAPRTGVAIGIALAGQVSPQLGIVRRLEGSPSWHDVPLGQRIADQWGRPATIETATNAAAYAEAKRGAVSGRDPALYVLLGRHVSSALLIGGHLVHGAHGAAGQLGHWKVASTGPRCVCGALGHLDPLASAQAIVRNTIGRASDSDASHAHMLRITGGRAEAMSAAQVVRMAAEGDSVAARVLGDALDGLALALADVSAIVDPAVIVIDGPLTEAGDAFFAPLRDRLAALCASFTEPPPIVGSAFYPSGTLLGARLLAGDTPSRVAPS